MELLTHYHQIAFPKMLHHGRDWMSQAPSRLIALNTSKCAPRTASGEEIQLFSHSGIFTEVRGQRQMSGTFQ